MRFIKACAIAGLAAACGPLPDIPAAPVSVSDDVPYPEFVPLDQVALESVEAEKRAEETSQDVAERVAVLRGRAARLRSVQAQ